MSLFGAVGHGQNTASGQRFAEPPVAAPRDAAVNLATKIAAPFTVAAVGDVMVKRTGGDSSDRSSRASSSSCATPT